MFLGRLLFIANGFLRAKVPHKFHIITFSATHIQILKFYLYLLPPRPTKTLLTWFEDKRSVCLSLVATSSSLCNLCDKMCMLRHVGTIHHASSGEGNHREKTCISRGKFEICVICEPSVNCCFTSVCLRSMCLSQIGRRCLKFIVVRSLNIVTVMIRNFQMFVEIEFELLLPILGNFSWKWFVCRI